MEGLTSIPAIDLKLTKNMTPESVASQLTKIFYQEVKSKSFITEKKTAALPSSFTRITESTYKSVGTNEILPSIAQNFSPPIVDTRPYSFKQIPIILNPQTAQFPITNIS